MADDVSGGGKDGGNDDGGNDSDGQIDPRYDRAFQRGFDGEVQTAPRGQSTLRRTAALNPTPQRSSASDPSMTSSIPVAQPTITPSGTSPSGPVPSGTIDSGHDVASRHDAETAAARAPVVHSATSRELTRNPFVIALALVAAALILGGAIWAYEGFASIVKNGGTRNEVEFWAAQTMSFGAPLAVIVGLGIVAVLLVLFAGSWRRDRI